MSKKRNVSAGQSAEPCVNVVVNRFDLLNDNDDSDTEDIQYTTRTKKSGSDDDDKPMNNTKKTIRDDSDGFQTVRQSKGRKTKQPIKVEKTKPTTKETRDKDATVKVRCIKPDPDEENEKQTKKFVVRKVVVEEEEEIYPDNKHRNDDLRNISDNKHKNNNDEQRNISDNKQRNTDDIEVSGEKKVIYVPPVASDGWTNQPRRRRYDRSDTSHKAEQNEEEPEANRMEYYNPGIRLHGDEMKLNTSWTVWIHENDNQDWSLASYKSIYEINCIGSMWRFLWVLDNLNKNVRQYYIMRNGITPIWEDNNNKQGAICSIMIDNLNRSSKHMRGDLGVDAFSAICILVMNESFVKNNQDINGLCYSIKSRSVLIKLWIKDFESNANFIEKLPITILKGLDSIISNMESRGHLTKSSGKSKISVQIKQIKPNY